MEQIIMIPRGSQARLMARHAVAEIEVDKTSKARVFIIDPSFRKDGLIEICGKPCRIDMGNSEENGFIMFTEHGGRWICRPPRRPKILL